MAIDRVAQLQTPQHFCAIDLGGRHGGSALERYINHGSPPRRLHPALPLTKRTSGEPLKRPEGRSTRRVFTDGGQGKGAGWRLFPIASVLVDRLTAIVLDVALPFGGNQVTTLSGIGM